MGTRAYQILDVGFVLESSQEAFLEAFHQDYGRFAVPVPSQENRLSIRFENGGTESISLEVDGVRQNLEDHPRPDRLASQRIAQLLMDRVETFTILHAAVLGTKGGALAISGPSGAGKTTLTLALLESGCSYLSDDFCPLHNNTGWVHPFPRSLWVRAKPGEESHNERQGKILFPLDDRAFTIETQPLPLRWLICLDVGAQESRAGKIRVGLRKGLEAPLLKDLQALEGTEVQKAGREGSLEWLIRHPHGHTRRIKELLRYHREVCWNAYSVSDAQPDFSQEPTLMRIPVHEAAFFLLRELKHSLIGEDKRKVMKPGALLGHIGELLSSVACFRLTPGPLERRMALIREAMGASA